MPKTIAITPSWYWPTGVTRVVGIPPFSIVELCVERNARENPSAPALVADSTRLTAGELKDEVWRRAAGLGASSEAIAIPAGVPTAESVLSFLGALAAGRHCDFTGGGQPPAPPAASADGFSPQRLSMPHLRAPAVTIAGRAGPVGHSHRSLLAAVISLGSFLEVQHGKPWMPLIGLGRWEGLLSTLAPLYFGGPLVLAPSGNDAEKTVQAITRERVGYAFADLDAAGRLTRDAKKSTKDARRVLDGFLLSVDGMFDADERRRVARAFECPALTVWGTPETGPVFASHPSWYMDESIGIPVTNAQVIPSDPRNGAPIQALWELVDSAEVTVWSPAVCASMSGEEGGSWAENRFRTGMLASSDANGMVYLLGAA
ncbi:MAG: AMP-binding protein [Dehalococcoidia bacterium]|nr:AMP-binding protein [Dehalococcoidia bacterium]